jgi:hypothetical protein
MFTDRQRRPSPQTGRQPTDGRQRPGASEKNVRGGRIGRMVLSGFQRLHRDQRGVISLLTVFAVLVLTMLLGMVMNVGRHVDAKVRLQNAADSAAISGGTVLARGMNALAFSNHLLCEVCSLTAFYREARDRHSDAYVPGILKAWDKAGELFRQSKFDRWRSLGEAIPAQTKLEQQLVTAFSAWAAASADTTLPILEAVLREQMIPEYQRAVVEAFPDIAQTAALRVSDRNGPAADRYGHVVAVLWRTNAIPVGYASEMISRTMPVVDPTNDALADRIRYREYAREQRRQYAERYLGIDPRRGTRYNPTWWDHTSRWTDEVFWIFDNVAKMSQYSNLFRQFACGQLHHLLEDEYPDSNLPFQIVRANESYDSDRLNPNDNNNAHLEQYYTFVGVAYRRQLPSLGWTRLFRGPLDGDAVAYAEVRMFVPSRRLVWRHVIPPIHHYSPGGGLPGEPMPLPPGDTGDDLPDIPEPTGAAHWEIGREIGVWRSWSLVNQHWRAQLTPATGPYLAPILQTAPPVDEFAGEGLRLPSIGGVTSDDIGRISAH